MRKILFTLLIGGFCALNAADSTDIEPGELGEKVPYQVGVPVVATWEHNLDAGTSVRTLADVKTTFIITRERSAEPVIEFPGNPEFDAWYPFYLNGTLNLKADDGETIEGLAFKVLHSELMTRRVETGRVKSQHDFENEFTKELKGKGLRVVTVKRYNIFGCNCVTWHTELYRRIRGVEALVETGADQVSHELGGVEATCTNPRDQGSITQLPNRGPGISSGHLVGNTIRTFVKKF
ncbi:MAG: hypothetical protein NT128_03335 [Proteobacteria bacterium]|nr:hypothetical protein [Pseudomonadota bacterium]